MYIANPCLSTIALWGVKFSLVMWRVTSCPLKSHTLRPTNSLTSGAFWEALAL